MRLRSAGKEAGVREMPSGAHRAVRFVALAFVGVVAGALLARFLFPAARDRNVLFPAMPVLLVAPLLLARAFGRRRSGA